MEGFGYSRSIIGQFWALGVIAEVVIFLIMSQLVTRFGLRSLMLWTAVLTALRWLLIGAMPESLGVMLFAQLLHAASFGVFHASAIALFHKFFIGRHQGRGQALYSSLSFGAGGSLGIFASGLLWEHLSPAVTFTLAAAAAAVGWLVALSALHPEHYRGPLSARQAL
jgi:PPP family 3-phenylpropionic acid transporter